MECKKKVESNNIHNSVNFHDLNFSIIQIELLNMQKQHEIVPIYLYLVPMNLKNWKFGKFCAPNGQHLKMVNWFSLDSEFEKKSLVI